MNTSLSNNKNHQWPRMIAALMCTHKAPNHESSKINNGGIPNSEFNKPVILSGHFKHRKIY